MNNFTTAATILISAREMASLVAKRKQLFQQQHRATAANHPFSLTNHAMKLILNRSVFGHTNAVAWTMYLDQAYKTKQELEAHGYDVQLAQRVILTNKKSIQHRETIIFHTLKINWDQPQSSKSSIST